jgi:holo-[acyl-carrier protein] synthase
MMIHCEKLGASLCGELMSDWNIGVDMVEIARFQQLGYSSNKQFYKRVFTPKEIEYCLSFSNPAPHFAANFAGKEAVYKAVNMFCDVKLHNIEILRDTNGAPEVNLHLSRKEKIDTMQVKVSLSHSLSHAIAFAVACKATQSVNSNSKAEAVSSHGF